MSFDFRKLINLVEQLLTESALTKGSQTVMNNKKLVADLADSIRDDSMVHMAAFPPGFGKQAQRMPDEDLAHWFLDNLDQIEQRGYNGVQYSRDGVNNLWIANQYVAGGHNWEDISGTLSMNLAKWYFLKNRNLLDPEHSNIPKFRGVRDLGRYMVLHYAKKLEELEAALRAAAEKKTARAYKLIDNEDYRIYIILNRTASCLYGLGSNWCTANSEYAGHFHSYSRGAMLFQLYPYDAPEIKLKSRRNNKEYTGKERYQFDAGGPNFMDLADDPADKAYIRKRFPYLYSDLSTALTAQKSNIEDFMDKAEQDPTLQKSTDTQIKKYDVNEQIALLSRLLRDGYFTEEQRTSNKSAEEPAPEN